MIGRDSDVSDIYICVNEYAAFRAAYEKGHLYILQWLVRVENRTQRKIDIHSRNEKAFRLE